MDKTLRKNIFLGLFVLIGIILFIIGIFLIGAKNEMFMKTFPISATFANATGLKVGSNVRYNGVKVGIVKMVKLVNDTIVQVDLQIEESKRGFIRNTAIASIVSDGLMGDKIIDIKSGKTEGEPLKNNDFVQVQNPLMTDEMLQTLSKTNANIKVITDNLKSLTSEIVSGNGTAQSLYKDTVMANNLRKSFSNLDAITSQVLDVSKSLKQVTNKIQNGNGALSEIINDTVLANNLSETMDKLKQTSDELIKASGSLTKTVEKANSGKGPINMLLSDTTLSANVQQSMLNIKKASVGLDENMEALKHNFLTRGYFRKMEKKKRKEDENK